ncbi:MAG: TonB-dependent receptor [Prolixibacteraceae bacterium]
MAKLTTFIFFLGLVQLMAVESYSQQTRLSIHQDNLRLEAVLKLIENQSEYFFLYNRDMVDVEQTVRIHATDATIPVIMDQLLKETGIRYSVVNRQIVLTKAEPEMRRGSSAQQAVIGRVTDQEGAVLPGVTVAVKGTTSGTITDENGMYTLGQISNDAILQFSFVGLETQEIPVAGRKRIDVVMIAQEIGIEEVVAVGYGTVRRKDLTGSVVSVSGTTLKDIPVTSAAQAIAGRLAGVQVTKTEGSPDAEIKIRIRGGGSITQDNSPLYIVDGFPVDNIGDIAPTDIASIDVLKDASSTAIYGARGANGVILVTTKGGGSDGKWKVGYNTYYGVKEVTKTLDVLDPYEYAFWQYEHDKITGYGKYENYYGVFQDVDLYKQMTGTNWQEKLFGKTGTSSYHNLNISGGTKKSKYSVSLTRNDEKEIMLGSGSERTNLNVKTTSKVKDWLSIDLNVRLSDSYQRGAGTSSNSRLAHAVQYRPINGLSDYVDAELVPAGDYEAFMANNREPVKQTNDDYRRLADLNFNFSGAAIIELSKNLKYRFEYGSLYRQSTNKHFYGSNTSNVQEYGGLPIARIDETDAKSYRLANILSYSKKNTFVKGANLAVTLGEELNSYKSESVISSSKYFPQYISAVSALSMMQLGAPDPTVTADNPASKISSFFGRVNYDLSGKYMLSAALRADGSSKFAKGNQWGYFPSSALAWRISDETLLANSAPWLSDLKLRASYGKSGNNRISDNAWQKTFNVSTGDVYIGDEATPTAFLAPNSILSNPKLKWETTETKNIGLDFGLYKQRLSGSVEIYKNKTKDLLISATIPSSSGYATQWQNVGQTSNRGLEITLNGIIVEKQDFQLSASFNIAFNRNRIDKLGEAKEWEQISMWYGWVGTGTVAGDYLVKEGGQIGQMYGYETEGMYSFNDFNYDPDTKAYVLKENVASNQALIGSLRFGPGSLKLKNQNEDFVVDASDKVIVGNANPKHTGGFNLACRYKGFDFSTFFNWVYGNDIYNANKMVYTSAFAYRFRNLLSVMNSDDRFTYISKETGTLVTDPAELAEMNKDAKLWSPGMSSLQLHSWVVEDGSFLRLNTLTLGYSLPKQILNKLKISQLRIYTVAYNLWTWTNYSGYDPEVDVARRTPLTPGVDWCAYPRSRSYNIGLNVEF